MEECITISGKSQLLSGKLEINSGSVPAELDPALLSLNYSPSAYIPMDDWRNVNDDELASLINFGQNADVKKNIHIFRLPDSLISCLDELGVTRFENIADLTSKFTSETDKVKFMQQELSAFVRQFEDPDKPGNAFLQGFHFSNPGLPTLAIDKSSTRLGLHIDFCAEFHTLGNYGSVNRISINLGRDARYFVFLNLSIEKLIGEVNKYERYDFRDGLESLDLPTLTKLSLKYLGEYPLVKIKIEPFEGYLAPTDNLLHDGSTMGKRYRDLTLSVLGYFSLPAYLTA